MKKICLCFGRILSYVFMVIFTIFLATVAFVCLIGFVGGVYTFICNQQTFTSVYIDTANAITCILHDEQEAVQIVLDHLERLQKMQRYSTSSDVMALIFSTLSAILVGLFAWFTGRSKKYANETETAFKKAEASYKHCLTYTVSIMKIHTDIIHARAALLANDQVNASERIVALPAMMKSLPQDIDSNIISKLLQELKYLTTAVGGFKGHAMGLPLGGLQTSMLQAAVNYENWLDEAIKVCERLLR
jgi:hypothetical protein